MNRHNILILFVFLFLQGKSQINIDTFSADLSKNHSLVYAIKKLDAVFKQERTPTTIHLEIDEKNFHPEGYQIKTTDKGFSIKAGGITGLMYAILDLRFPENRKNLRIENPKLDFRAIKFNLPWDSYRTGQALSLHTETCKDTIFWESFLDMMADHHFNKLTLWNLHPFNYLVKIEESPEACTFSATEMEEWERLWRYIFRNAKIRGIETYLVNWNIFIPPGLKEQELTEPFRDPYRGHLAEGDTSQVVKDYTRLVVKETINKYPDLTGLGITLGEGMGGMNPEEREKWVLETIIQGAREADRKIKFIHRVPLSANTANGGSTSTTVEQMTRETLDTLSCFEDLINIELKFNWSHAYSTPDLMKVHGGQLSDRYWNPEPENYKLAWMMRNEDFFMLRWGQSDFIRTHIAQNTASYVNGYFIGSECYIPAKDYISKQKDDAIKYAFQRQWMYYLMWGKFLYFDEVEDALFVNAFDQRYPKEGLELFKAQNLVGKIPLIIASYWNARWDFTLYTEGLLSMYDGKVDLMSIEEMSKKVPMDTSYQGISSGGTDSGKINPIALADSMIMISRRALLHLRSIDLNTNVELALEVSDIKIWAEIGQYFALKLKAAFHIYLYDQKKNGNDLVVASEFLSEALDHYAKLVNISKEVYDPVPLMHLTFNKSDPSFHWSMFYDQAKKELEDLTKRTEEIDGLNLRTQQSRASSQAISKNLPANNKLTDNTRTETLINGDDQFLLTNHDWNQLETRKASFVGEPELVKAYQKLRSNADLLLSSPNFSVTSKTTIPPSGDKRDYFSLGPYWWPDRSKPDGLPWINRDGEINPMTRGEHVDIEVKNQFFSTLKTLTWAYYFSEDEQYAAKIKQLLLTWFVNEETKMNPNLNFAQGIPGRSTGRGIGIIEFTSITSAIDAIEILHAFDLWTEDELTALKTWFADFQEWLFFSEYGTFERNKENNHGTWYDVIYTTITLFLREEDKARNYIHDQTFNRVDHQINDQGHQTHELKRTKALSYSTMNLNAFIKMSEYAEKLNIDLWNYNGPQGQSIQKAVQFLQPYTSEKTEWPYQQITSIEKARERLRGLLLDIKHTFDMEIEIADEGDSSSYPLKKLLD